MAQSKILFTFNKLYSKLIKDINRLSPAINSAIKKHYPIVDKSCTDYIVKFTESTESVLRALTHPDTPRPDFMIAHSIMVSDVSACMSAGEVDSLWNHIYMLLVFAYMYSNTRACAEGDAESDTAMEEAAHSDSTCVSDAVLNKVVKIIDMITSSEDAEDEIDDVIDQDLVSILRMIKPSGTNASDDPDAPDAPDAHDAPKAQNTRNPMPGSPSDTDDMFAKLGNSKIASLAKEIASEISESDLDLGGADGLANLMKGNVLSDIIKKVSSKISDKMENGDLQQSDLMNETMDIMKLLGGGGNSDIASMMKNPMIASLLKNFKKADGGKAAASAASHASASKHPGGSARDRLRKKVADRKQARQVAHTLPPCEE